LGGKLLRRELGDAYVDHLFRVWDSRVPREADLCAYWLEAARAQVEAGRCRRAGLLATQGIRGGANREVLSRIKRSGEIFFAESDRPWVLDGANVHVSMIGFDDDTDGAHVLDGERVPHINPNLTAAVDVTTARSLASNLGLSFMGDTKGGSFDLSEQEAIPLLTHPNPNGRPGSDVLVPWVNGIEITRRSRFMWIIDFGIDKPLKDAAGFEAVFRETEHRVRTLRTGSRTTTRCWWQHERPRSDMRNKLEGLPRFVATVRHVKHVCFQWLSPPTLPDSALIVFAGADDFLFGVLHSRCHEVWARAQGTQVRERESGFRYTPTTCFETFPFPELSEDQREAIAEAAHELDRLRSSWLNPPEWTREELLEFPGSVDGPWSRYVRDPDSRGIGTVRYPRIVPRDEACAQHLKVRTLTNIYNQRPTWLDLAHRRLDEAVLAAYGWPPDLSDAEILERLLALNLERSADPNVEARSPGTGRVAS
jgi:type II restriction/modification system DNA methylase subunit YeeA